MLRKNKEKFPFSKNDVVLAKYENEVFYAKVLTISYKRKIARLVFDDDSREDVPFHSIFDVNETTSDIICVVCKKDGTEIDNDIVLCDQCNVGYHQCCHDPVIKSDVLKPEVPWECTFCVRKTQNPYVESNPFDDEETEDIDWDNDKIIATPEKDGFQQTVKDDEKEFEAKESEIQLATMVNDENKIQLAMVDENNSHLEKTNADTIQDLNNNEQPDIVHQLQCNDVENIGNYGEQVIIAHADSTSNEEEDLIVDIESDCETDTLLPIKEESKEFIKSNELVSTNSNEGLLKVCDRYSTDLPSNNWLVKRLTSENKLNIAEVKDIERSVMEQHRREENCRKEAGNLILKDYLKAKAPKKVVQKLFKPDGDDRHSQKLSPTTMPTQTTRVQREELLSSTKKDLTLLSQPPKNSSIFLPVTGSFFDEQFLLNKRPSLPLKRQMSDITGTEFRPFYLSPKSISPTTMSRREHFERQLNSQNQWTKELGNKKSWFESEQLHYIPSSLKEGKTKIYKPTTPTNDFLQSNNIFKQDHLTNKEIFHPYRRASVDIHTKFLQKPKVALYKCPSEGVKERNTNSFDKHQPDIYTKQRSRMYSDSFVHAKGFYDACRSSPLKRPSSEPSEGFERKRSPSTSIIIPSPDSFSYYQSGNRGHNMHQDFIHVSPQKRCGKELNEHAKIKLDGHKCLNCGDKAQLLCSACRKVRYCSKNCQLQNWKDHLYQCKAFKY